MLHKYYKHNTSKKNKGPSQSITFIYFFEGIPLLSWGLEKKKNNK